MAYRLTKNQIETARALRAAGYTADVVFNPYRPYPRPCQAPARAAIAAFVRHGLARQIPGQGVQLSPDLFLQLDLQAPQP